MTLLRPLNSPQPISVDAMSDATPIAVFWRGQRRWVAALIDRWRIEDEWWRQPIARDYYLIALRGGGELTVFRDRLTDMWYAQPYRAPLTDSARATG